MPATRPPLGRTDPGATPVTALADRAGADTRAASSSKPAAWSRVEGLDLWRALLMLGGLFVHASMCLPSQPLFSVVGDVSSAFRMGCFFAVSGLLSAIVLDRRDVGAWLSRRLGQLGVPAVFGMLLISPLVWMLVNATRGPAVRPALMPFEWHHLWFLFALMLYSVAAAALHVADRRVGLIERLDRRVGMGSIAIAVALVAAGAALLSGIAQPVLNASLSADYAHSFRSVQQITGFAPMFLLGFVFGRAPRLRERAVSSVWLSIAVLAMVTLAYLATHLHPALAQHGATVRLVAAALCPPVAFLLILRSALTMRRVPRIARQLADASYTIYLLHYPIAVAFNTQVAPDIDPLIGYALCVLTAGLVSFAIHQLLVTRSTTLQFVLNGKRPVRRAVDANLGETPRLA